MHAASFVSHGAAKNIINKIKYDEIEKKNVVDVNKVIIQES